MKYVCMYESIYNVPLLQPKQSRVRASRPNRRDVSLLQNSVSVSVGSRSDGGREFHSFGAQAAKQRGPKLEVRQASTCRSSRATERGDDLYWYAQLLEVLRSGLMATLEDDNAELKNGNVF